MGWCGSSISISAVSVFLSDGNSIRAQLDRLFNASMFLDLSAFAGADSSGRPLIFAPNQIQSGSSISHWDTSLLPNQLMNRT